MIISNKNYGEHRNIIRYFHFGPMDHGSVLVKFQAEGKFFEITRTIHSNSERSKQFLVTEYFFSLFLEVSHTLNKLEQVEFKLEKIIGI